MRDLWFAGAAVLLGMCGSMPAQTTQGEYQRQMQQNFDAAARADFDRQFREVLRSSKKADTVATPTPDIAVVKTGPTVRLVGMIDRSPHAAMFYTTDGSKPSEHSSLYTGPFEVPAKTRLRVLAVEKDREPSDVVSRKLR